jgi:hypothetical protein
LRGYGWRQVHVRTLICCLISGKPCTVTPLTDVMRPPRGTPARSPAPPATHHTAQSVGVPCRCPWWWRLWVPRMLPVPVPVHMDHWWRYHTYSDEGTVWYGIHTYICMRVLSPRVCMHAAHKDHNKLTSVATSAARTDSAHCNGRMHARPATCAGVAEHGAVGSDTQPQALTLPPHQRERPPHRRRRWGCGWQRTR